MTRDEEIRGELGTRLEWLYRECRKRVRRAGMSEYTLEQHARDLQHQILCAFLDNLAYFDGPDRVSLAARVQRRLSDLLLNHGTTARRQLDRAARAEAEWDLAGGYEPPADEALGARQVDDRLSDALRKALRDAPRRLLSVLAVHVPIHATRGDFEASAADTSGGGRVPVRSVSDAWALFEQSSPQFDDAGDQWTGLVAEILRSAAPLGTLSHDDRTRVVGGLQKMLQRAYREIADWLRSEGLA